VSSAPGSSPLAARPIGVFDSGVGGLTVLRALRAAMPGESFLYLGDTARLPYGTKSPHTVVRYAIQAADELAARDIKCLVVACNTASAAALAAMRERYAGTPVIGVIEPGARAACAATRNGSIAVLGTDSTVRGGAYTRAICALLPKAKVTAIACSLFVALAEEGWTDGAVAQAAAARYLQPLWSGAEPVPDTVVLGCTHFPMLAGVIAATIGPAVCIVDSALTTAATVRQQLATAALTYSPTANAPAAGELQFLVTDGVERFAAIGSRFLGQYIDPAMVTLIDM
jgi:glutamate racemase